MSSAESAFIEALRPIATDAGARGLLDDAALLTVGDRTLVLTKDMIVEGVHYRADDPPEDIAWKLVAVNLSDLAGKGARPLAAQPVAPQAIRGQAGPVFGAEIAAAHHSTVKKQRFRGRVNSGQSQQGADQAPGSGPEQACRIIQPGRPF